MDPFVRGDAGIRPRSPVFCSVLANTALSTVPGVSGAGPSPEKTVYTPILDAELITRGHIRSMPVRPDTPTGCPTPASITRAMMDLCRIEPLFVNAGLCHPPTVPCLDLHGRPGADPRTQAAVPDAALLFDDGEWAGRFLGRNADLIVLGECVPGGTTTALCVLRALGYTARVSSSFVHNPLVVKEEIARAVLARLKENGVGGPLDIVREAGDPMMPVAAGIASACPGKVLLAGGTQMLAVAALVRAIGHTPPPIVTTCYVCDDPSANVEELADAIGVKVIIIDPGFGDIGHSGLARYCIGEVKEGMGAGGAMYLAYLLGHDPGEIRRQILATIRAYT